MHRQIAVGTVVLLLGVLALSWRLSNDPTTRPPVSQNTLTPAMGFVDDDSDIEAEDGMPIYDTDEEAHPTDNKESPHLGYVGRMSSPTNICSPTTRDNDLLNITRLRRKGITESEEIWEELEDDSIGEMSSFARRRSSVWYPQTPKTAPGGTAADRSPTESTALLARSGTGRSYVDKRRRHSAQPIAKHDSGRRRVSSVSQEALGGWWKMKRWWTRGRDRDRRDISNGQ